MDNILLPKWFVTDYIAIAQPVYANIYIYCFANAYNNRISINPTDLAQKFNILETDIFNSFYYWQDKNLIEIDVDKKGNITVEFMQEPKIAQITNISVLPIKQEVLKTAITKKPMYSPTELELYQNSHKEIGYIFDLGEKALGTLLDAKELGTIFSFYDWLRLPIEVIEELFLYSLEQGYKNLTYIEKIAIDWSNNNIKTKEDARAHLQDYNKDYRAILAALGQKRRDPAKKEIEYMDKWLKVYGLPLEIILEACDKTIINLGKPGFSYTDKILESWHKANVSTIEDIKMLESSFNNKDCKKIEAVTTKKSKFASYAQTPLDYNELERISLDLAKNSLKKGG